MSQCESRMLTGGQCDLPSGHDGVHEKQYPSFRARWTDEQVRSAVDRYSSRFD